jgi:hypothetical protein
LEVAGLALGPAVLALMVPVALMLNLPNLVGVFPKASRKIKPETRADVHRYRW